MVYKFYLLKVWLKKYVIKVWLKVSYSGVLTWYILKKIKVKVFVLPEEKVNFLSTMSFQFKQF